MYTVSHIPLGGMGYSVMLGTTARGLRGCIILLYIISTIVVFVFRSQKKTLYG